MKRLSVCLAVLIFLSSCSADNKAKQQKPKTVPVTVAVAAEKDVPVQLTAVGNVEPYSTVAVNSRVAGQLMQVHFKEGQAVNKGDRLLTIDTRPFEAALKQSEAALARDTAQMENALQQSRRYEQLLAKGYVSKADYDQIRANADALQAVVNAGKSAVENARLQLSYCYIDSPVNGITGSLQLNQGNLIKENDKTIVTINQVQPIFVAFALPEQHLPEIKKYMASGKLTVAAVVANEVAAEVGALTFIDNAIDRGTGTIRMKGTFENKNKKLWPGQFVNVTLKLTVQQKAVTAPSRAVLTGQQGQYLFVVKQDSMVEMRQVTARGIADGVSVIDKGLVSGERVVTDGQLRIVPGVTVDIKDDSKAQGKEQPK
ncbi:MAG: efflux RND transporter periplasmic adaptor subunit [Nitrospirae bacterium]|nr:efflux RND transporter periplasmic adaptor subunit [Nitrospirota bacterium]